MSRKFIALIGPTSSGKTSLALKICKELGGEIVSVDSRQAVKFFDVGTGKTPVSFKASLQKNNDYWLMDGIKVYGYDLFDPNQEFSVVDFCEFVSKISFTSDLILFVGGTGFYFDILSGNIQVSNIKPNFSLRHGLSKKSTEELFELLTKLDVNASQKIDRFNKVRLIRAVEISLSKKENTVDKLDQKEKVFSKYVNFTKVIGLNSSRDLLFSRVNGWAKEVFSEELFCEVRKLEVLGYGSCRSMSGLVYKTAKAYVTGSMSFEAASDRTCFDLHAYIRRQQTYFKKMCISVWLDPFKTDIYDTILKEVENTKYE